MKGTLDLSAHLLRGVQVLPRVPECARLSQRVIVILGLNPSQYALQGTNCYLVGTGAARLLVDSGEGRPGFHARLAQLLASERCCISDVLLTHSHADHIGGVSQLLRDYPEIRVWRCVPQSGIWEWGRLGTGEDAVAPQQLFAGSWRRLQDGQFVRVPGATVRAIHTPGHASDHLCYFLEEETALFSGDHILGVGTVIVDDLASYVASLERLEVEQPWRIYPGHGPVIDGEAAKRRPREYIEHRLARLSAARNALVHGAARSLESVARAVYGSKLPQDAYLRRAACHNTRCALKLLADRGVACSLPNDQWRLSDPLACVNFSAISSDKKPRSALDSMPGFFNWALLEKREEEWAMSKHIGYD